MFPMGCMGWRMATTAVPPEAAVETTDAMATVAARARRRVRAAGACLFMGHFLVREKIWPGWPPTVTTGC
jgi:hypothetical protein